MMVRKKVVKMKKIKPLALSVLLLGFSSKGFAGCDTCIMGKVNEATSSISKALSETNAKVTETNTSVQSLTTAVNETSVNLNTLLELQQQELLTALNSMVNRVLGSHTILQKTLASTTDHQNDSLHQLLKDLQLQQHQHLTAMEFSPEVAQPITGDIMVNRAAALTNAIKTKKQRVAEGDQLFQAWLKIYEDSPDQARQTSIDASMLALSDTSKLIPFLKGNLVNEEESKALQTYLKLLLEPQPTPMTNLDQLINDPAKASEEVQRLLDNLRKSVGFHTLNKQLADKMPLINAEHWNTDYIAISTTDEGMTSIEEFLASETTRKLSSEAWLLDIKKKTPAGLMRENVYQKSISNYLLKELLEQERQSVLMLSLMAAKDE